MENSIKKKSIVIIGKGESILKCTKEFIDSFDEVAICNRPVYEGYEHLISNRADYDFVTNLITVRQYSEELYARLGIKQTIITGDNSELRNSFNYKNLDPSTGTLAFYYFLKNQNYDKICMVGFDLFQKDKKVYYFNRNELNESLNYLVNGKTYDYNLIQKIESGHNIDLTYEYMIESIKQNKEKKFMILSNYPFDNLENLIII